MAWGPGFHPTKARCNNVILFSDVDPNIYAELSTIIAGDDNYTLVILSMARHILSYTLVSIMKTNGCRAVHGRQESSMKYHTAGHNVMWEQW